MTDLWAEFLTLTHAIHAWHIVAFLAMLLLAPLAIARLMKFRKYPTIQLIDDEQTLPTVSEVYFAHVREDVEPYGFESLGVYCSTDAVTNAFFICEMHINRHENALLLVSSIYGSAPSLDAEPLQAHYCEYLTHFENTRNREATKEKVLTNNTVDPGSFTVPAEHHVVKLPQIDSAGQLFEYHQKIVKSLGLSERTSPKHPIHDQHDVPTYLQSALQDSYDREVDNGILKLYQTEPSSESYYCPTLLGSYVLTWKELWPMKAFRLAKVRRTARRDFRALQADV